ncbi:unnamed protein product [Lupinus luteus]|uniref:Peroxidase n=1 Tax=Lupinus luteus TaxID=3873 RepID=A0AAV1VRT4_LUPLU
MIFSTSASLFGKSQLQLNYYTNSCSKAEEIIKQQVFQLYNKHGNTAISWVRNLFHDCMVKSCDASLLLVNRGGVVSEQTAERSFGMRNFKYVNTIKEAVEQECPLTLGGPNIEMKTGRRDSKESYAMMVEEFIPNHNDSISLVLSSFQAIGVDIEATVALLGAHSVGRVHCKNIVHRLYPTVDETLNPSHAAYLKHRCPTPNPDPNAVQYVRNDLKTPMIIDNNYYKNILQHKGLLTVDEELATDPRTAPYVQKMADDNEYFRQQFSRAIVLLSENNPLIGDEGEIRKDCGYLNAN